ncbi:outer membrane beta-barrel protein [Hydrogenophaga sp. PAMC20947]|uniref:outer membrane beta-barrel protein n=1 Tax=Hydrogenophaga sp. PAMC20947 TaxID=2565558 RepID=UPI00109DACB0|nr:outer membrane beta-barrel protein [Hydrogenophaga sp. PAMC20947]QCB45343.1 porin family protein [Hydrogenophaga sp. PAMC20947]
MKLKKLNALMLLSGAAVFQAHAGMVQDANGNVAYDTAAECDAAVQGGQARFYQPSTKMAAQKRKGEATVRVVRLDEVDAQYKLGACDLGVGRKFGRNGVAKPLQGKYVPFSPAMPVQVYASKSGETMRVSMAKCDNRFSDNLPRAVPMPVAAPVPVAVAPAPVPKAAPMAAPVVAAPAPAPVVAAPAARMTPYVFGTVGAQRDLIGNGPIDGLAQFDDHDTKLAAQGGVGVQFGPLWGIEGFAQGGKGHSFENGSEYKTRVLGLRGTVGQDIGSSARVFAKLGVASVTHTGDSPSASQTRPTVGLGMLMHLTENLALRGDFDHYVKKSGGSGASWKALNYVGVGLQYSFMP